ncbi:O-antigen ligase family protein [Vibrio natriegens]|uniref:O-antigen ligase family protein n=1 Tax=Vibrio natriegens TaxID=691 RepID=UPI001592E255|nr:O-antigen ligase family protein [Vibrio natriegens]
MKIDISLAQYYPKFLLIFILVGSVFLSFTPYWLDLITLYDNKRFFVVFYLLMTATVVICSHSTRQKIIKAFSNLSYVSKTLIFLALFNSLLANFHSLYWIKSQAVFTYALLFIIVIAVLRSVVLDNKAFILRLYIWLSCAIFLSVLLYHWISTSIGVTPNYRSIFSFVNPRNINYIQVWLVLPLVWLSWQKYTNSKGLGLLYTIPVIMHFSLLFALDSRGAFIAICSGLALWLILSPNKLSKLKFIISLLVLGLLIKWLIFTPLPQYWVNGVWPEGQGDIRLGDSNRLELWSNAIAMITFWGLGGDTFVCNNDLIAHSPHNSILLITVEWGVITTLCFIILFLLVLYRTFTTSNEQLKIWGITLLSGFAYSLISSVLNSSLSQGVAVISVALFWAISSETRTPSTSKIIAPVFLTISHIILVFIAIWALIFIGYKTYLRIDNQQYRHIKVDYYMPQFWIEQNCMDGEPKLNLSN